MLKPDGDKLPQAPDLTNGLAPDQVQAWLERPEQQRATALHPRKRLAENASLERFDVDGDVGQLGHRGTSSLPGHPGTGTSQSLEAPSAHLSLVRPGQSCPCFAGDARI